MFSMKFLRLDSTMHLTLAVSFSLLPFYSVAVEKSLDAAKDKAPPSNVIFDDSGNFVLYPTMAGIKVVNIVTNQLVRLIGKVSSPTKFTTLLLI